MKPSADIAALDALHDNLMTLLNEAMSDGLTDAQVAFIAFATVGSFAARLDDAVLININLRLERLARIVPDGEVTVQ